MKRKILVLILLTLAIFTASFCLQPIKVNAEVSAIESNEFILVGYNGYSPESYFDNLKNCKIQAPSTKYYNREGNLTDEYYVVNAESGLFGGTISGESQIQLYNDMITLADTNCYYASASVGVQQFNSNKSSICYITLSSGDDSYTMNTTEYSSTKYNITWLESEDILVKDTGVQFKFETLTKAWNATAKFTLFEPKVNFSTKVNYLNMLVENQTVAPNEVIKLNAEHNLSNLKGESLLSYYQDLHKIKYEIVDGNESAKIVGNYLYITGTNNDTIKVRAYCEKSSNLDEGYIYSETVTINLNANKYMLSQTSNFDDCATILGLGEYNYNQTAYIKIYPKQGYTFMYAIVNNQKIENEIFNLQIQRNLNIEFYFKKNITIKNVIVNDKVYDGTNEITIKQVEFEGLENSDVIYIDGLTGNFVSPNVGNRVVEFNISSNYKLVGGNSNFYSLSKLTVPNTTAMISKKDVTVYAKRTVAIYGEPFKEIEYLAEGLIQNDVFTGALSKSEGIDAGVYKSNIGSLDNPNYNITFVENDYVIEKAILEINQIVFEEKIYDKTCDVNITATLNGLQYEDKLYALGTASFTDCNAGYDKTYKIVNLQLSENTNNYILSYPTQEEILTGGTILQKNVEVVANAVSKTYGEQDPELTYFVTLLEGDTLIGSLSREEGEIVGDYSYNLGSLKNDNYQLKLVGNNKFTINKRNANVIPNAVSKVYGNQDPELTYTFENLIQGDTLEGSLSREQGENVGKFVINLGTLSNDNYNLSISLEYLEIIKRDISVVFFVSNKYYDATDNAEFTYSISNTAFNDVVTVDATIKFLSTGVGENIDILIKDIKITSDNKDNYNLLLNSKNVTATIFQRPIYITINHITKTYGEQDPELSYVVENMVESETLNGSLKRNVGENVGNYTITIGNLQQANPNYLIELKNVEYLTINKKEIYFKIENQVKVYGEQDPEITLIKEEGYDLCFNDDLSLLTGNPIREEGENVGFHYYLINDLSLGENYKVCLTKCYLNIVKRNLNIKMQPLTKTYGDEDPVYEYTLSNYIEGDVISLAFSREQGEDVGHYEIQMLTTFDARYNLLLETDFLTITPKNLTLTLENKTKVYGSIDPNFNFVITEGKIVNNDRLVNLISGNFEREVGEDVGVYEINSIGTFSLGSNYIVNFEKANLTIVPAEITIQADNILSTYLGDEKQLTYTFVQGELKFDDELTGNIEREQGNFVGEYKITQGTLNVSSNYILTFIEGKYIIEKSNITIILGATKQYGEQDPSLISKIVGAYSADDDLNAIITRQNGETVGNYKILAEFTNPNYNIAIESGYLSITRRIIEITAKSYEINYGEELPEFEYEIVNGTIVNGDELTGELYTNNEKNVGSYPIRNNFSINSNYKIVYNSGILTINALNIKVAVKNITKTYGEAEPEIEYEITEGELLYNDQISGNILRASGEDAGTYDLINNLFNANYTIDFDDEYVFEIFPKDCYLKTKIYDKVYDGTVEARLKFPTIVGIYSGDDVKLDFNEKTAAYFVDAEPGENKEVKINIVQIIGEQAKNYTLKFETYFGTITRNSLEDKETSVKVSVINDSGISNSSKLVVTQINDEKLNFDSSKNIIAEYKIDIDGEDISFNNEIVNISLKLSNVSGNVYVYKVLDDGKLCSVDIKYKDGILSFNDTLGTYVVSVDNEEWLDIFTVLMLIVNLGVFAFISIYYNRKAKRLKAIADNSYQDVEENENSKQEENANLTAQEEVDSIEYFKNEIMESISLQDEELENFQNEDENCQTGSLNLQNDETDLFNSERQPEIQNKQETESVDYDSNFEQELNENYDNINMCCDNDTNLNNDVLGDNNPIETTQLIDYNSKRNVKYSINTKGKNKGKNKRKNRKRN